MRNAFVMRSCHPSSTITRKLINKKRLRLLLAWKLKLAARGAWSRLIDQKAWNLAIFIRDKKHESNAHVHARQRVRCPCALRDSRPPRQARVKAGRLPLPRSTSLRRPRYRNSFNQGGLSHPLGKHPGSTRHRYRPITDALYVSFPRPYSRHAAANLLAHATAQQSSQSLIQAKLFSLRRGRQTNSQEQLPLVNLPKAFLMPLTNTRY